MNFIFINRAFAEKTSFLSVFSDLEKANLVSSIVSGFNYVAGFIAAFVVLVALWGVIKLMSRPGSSSDKSESRGIFWNLLVGVLFFALIYFFFTNILSPDLGKLVAPKLGELNNTSYVGAGTAGCSSMNPPCGQGTTCVNLTGTPTCVTPTATGNATDPLANMCGNRCASNQHCAMTLGTGGGGNTYTCVSN